MKRTICLLILAALALSIAVLPVFADQGDSMTDPVEIIDTTPVGPLGPGGPTWSFLNLLCTLLSVLFGCGATGKAVGVNRNKKEAQIGDEKFVVVPRIKKASDGTTETSVIRKSPLWKAGLFDLGSSFASVATFLLTQDTSTQMVMTDKWTPLMAGILAVSAGVYALTAGGKTLSKDVADKVLSAVKKG